LFIYLTKDFRHLIKLPFNIPKLTRGLDALSTSLISSHSTIQFFCEENYCGALGGHLEFQSPSENQDKMLEASCQGGPRHVDKEVGLHEEEEAVHY
jgi:hypothetical protein